MTASNTPPTCPLSGEVMQPAFRAPILGKYDVQYFYSETSGLLQTEPPYWLDEAYASAIADMDIGMLNRNITNVSKLALLIPLLFNQDGRFLDVSGGYGILARLLRDKGFDCYTTDKYAANLFAKGYEPDANFCAEALFAFEVLEHLPDPLAFIADAFERYNCRKLIFSAETFSDAPPAADWWYYSPETGQHITFFQERTLTLMASKLGCHCYRLDNEFFLFSDTALTRAQQKVLVNERARLRFQSKINQQRKGKSLLPQDYQRLVELAASSN